MKAKKIDISNISGVELGIDLEKFDKVLSEISLSDNCGSLVVLTGTLAERVAFIVSRYKGGTIEENIYLSEYLVMYIKDFIKHQESEDE